MYRKGFFMKNLLTHIKAGHLYVCGLIIIILSLIPSFILGENSIVYYHDQLDGELIAYIYQAKYLFSGQNIIPEFMNGAGKSALVAPAPLAVFLFRIFPPFTSYMILLIMGQFCAYTGMFQLIRATLQNHYVALITALLFAFLPFLPVYGLSQYGIPMLLYCFLMLCKKKPCILPLLYIALYTAMSSPVLIGFVWILIVFLLLLYFLCTKKVHQQKPLLLSFVMMLGIYIATNLSLISQLVGIGSSYESHKAEYTLTPLPLFTQWLSYLTNNTSHATDYHGHILIAVLGTMLLGLLFYKKLQSETGKLLKYLIILFVFTCSICFSAALWETSFIIGIREHFGALKSFQFSRVLWLTPTLWYSMLALCFTIFLKEKSYLRLPQLAISFVVLAMVGIACLKGSFVKPNLQELLQKDMKQLSWSDYLALGVMNQVEDYLLNETGQSIKDYTVVSLGIDPSAALYHGFYCIDGYSNNYDLAHKHAFRNVIAPELNKNDYLKSSFDGWGNRCYLFSSEIPGYYNIEKNSFWYNQLELNTQALKNLGCNYILSAAYIVNAEDLHLNLLREEPFNTETSYYQIFLYEIN